MTANNILLIDKRISHYEAIIAAVDPALSKGITFDYYTDTFETLKERMVAGSSGVLANSVGLVQHNYKMPTFKMVDAPQTTSSTIEQVEIQDSELSTWAPLKEFIEWCKTELSTAHFDMMACALYSNPDWKYVIDRLSAQTGVEIRASTDDTGSSSLGENWVLESHVGINLKEVYFNDSIDGYVGLLATPILSEFTIGRMNNLTFDDEGQIKLYDVVNSMVTAAMAQEALSGLVAGYVSELYSYLNLSYVDVYNRNNPVLDATVTFPVISSYASNTNTFSYSVNVTGPAENPLSLDKTKYKFIVESVNTATNSRTTVSQPTWDSVASPTTFVCAQLLPLTSYSIIVTPTLFNSSSNLKSLLPVKTFTLTTPLDYGLISSITFTKEGTSWYFNFQYSGYASLTSFTMGLRWIQSAFTSGGYRFSISQNFSSVPISNGTNKYLITDTQNFLNVGGPSLIANVVTATIDYVSGTATKQNITTFVPNPIVGGPYVVGISNFNTDVYPGTCTATIPTSLHQQIGGGKNYFLRFVEKDTGTITNMSGFDSASSSSSLTIPISLYGKTFTCELLIQNVGYSYTGDYVILPYTSNLNYFTVPNPTGLFPTVTTELDHKGMIWSLGGATDDVRLFKVTWLTTTAGLNVSSPNYTSKVRVNIKLNSDSSYRFTGVYNYADGFGYSIFHSSIRTSQGQNGGTWVVDIRSENSDGTITTNYSTFSQYAGSGAASGVYTSLSNMVAAAGTSTVLYGVGVI